METIQPSVPVWYVVFWGGSLLFAVLLALRYRVGLPTLREYSRFLLQPWKIVSYVGGAALFVVAAPLSGDPTWDTANSLLISTLTFLSAPWAVGLLYRALVGRAHPAHGVIAAVLAVGASCWSYDVYVWLRNGVYPPSWAANLPLSLSLYLAGGLFWNLERRDERTSFAFRLEPWFAPVAPGQVRAIWPVALIFVAFVIFVVGLFVWEHQHQ